MGADVHKLTERMLPGEINADLVGALKGLLERAERGEITAMAWAGVNPNDTTFTGWDGAGGTLFHMAASIGVLQWRFMQMIQDEADNG